MSGRMMSFDKMNSGVKFLLSILLGLFAGTVIAQGNIDPAALAS